MNADAVIVGLGNPGPRYAFTRHNVGFIALDILAQDFGTKFSKSGLGKSIEAETCDVTINGKRSVLIKPLTFMNLSGESVQRLFGAHNHLRNVPLIVVHDEADLAFGKMRVKKGGGDAGHNGLKSIRAVLGHGEFYRLRLGVGRPGPETQMDLKDYVLKAFEKNEEEVLMTMMQQSEKVMGALVLENLMEAQALASKDLLAR